ncbi:hypothetical protein [Yinghuangia seranimata]|uniref:hypothetical protein n=1 Tax=Yinghuangia seranimata TaxID=408067 RepID=UPI00248BF9C9|nr:hypothetical protein [Yinghuangia seranimata]MDI2127284.1 hypothetical protein [Yinghuangia seranimata]
MPPTRLPSTPVTDARADLAEAGLWYAVATGCAAVAMLATGAGPAAAAGVAAGLLAAGAVALLVIIRNSHHTARNSA